MSRAERSGPDRWIDRALFAPLDPTATALFRIALAGMTVLVFWPTRWPLPVFLETTPALRSAYSDVFLTSGYWMGILAAAALLALGVRPRFAGAALAVLLLPLVPFEGRQPARQLLVVTVAAFSFLRSDAALAIAWGRGHGPALVGPSWPIRIVQMQLSALYAANAISKTTPDYLSGCTIETMMQTLPNFLVRPSDGHLVVGPLSIPLWLAATGVVLIEYALAAGFWMPRARGATAVLGVAFHAALRYVIRIGYLDLVALFLYAAFLLPFEGRQTRVRTGRNGGALDAREAPVRP
jgi:hypothetical protein